MQYLGIYIVTLLTTGIFETGDRGQRQVMLEGRTGSLKSRIEEVLCSTTGFCPVT